MQMRINNSTILSLAAASLLVHSSSYANGDGASSLNVIHSMTDNPIIEIGCVDGAGYCPQHPDGFSLNPQQVIGAIQHEVVCSEDISGATHLHDGASPHLDVTDNSSYAAAALSHAILSNPTLQLHEIKLAIQKLAHLESDIALRAFAEIYAQSDKLAKRVIGRAKLPEVREGEKAAMIERQAADLRRVVILALRSINQVETDRLLAQALDDSAPAVAVAAGREIQRRTNRSGNSLVDQRCAYATDVQGQTLCNLMNSGEKHVRP